MRARFRPSSSDRGVGEGEFANNFQQQNCIPANNEAAKRGKRVGNGKRANTDPAPFIMENFTEKNAFWPRFALAKMLTLGVRNVAVSWGF